MQKPRALQPGDVVRIVSPASPIVPERLEPVTKLLEGAGYRVELGEHVFAAQGYLAGSDPQRAQDLQEAFDDPKVQGILCSRGGYGSARLLPLLDLDRMAASRKVFAGFSDITSLHLALNHRGLPTIYAAMGLTFFWERQPSVIDSFLNAFTGGQPVTDSDAAGKTLIGGTSEGVVTGGCLSLLGDSIGTPGGLKCKDKIVIIEDVGENPHRVDAHLTHLLLSGELEQAAGIVFGEMSGTDEKSDPDIGAMPWRDIIRDRVASLRIPTIYEYPFGHIRTLLSLPLGISARLDADAGTLEYLESVCG